jgi:hypothetical protein
MTTISQILLNSGWKELPNFTPEQMGNINQFNVNNKSPNFILCPFGFKGGLDKRDKMENISKTKSGLKPSCPIHGDNCPGFKKYR